MIAMKLHICWENISVLWLWFPWKTPLIRSSLLRNPEGERWRWWQPLTNMKIPIEHHLESLAKNNPKSWTAIHPLPHLVGNQCHHTKHNRWSLRRTNSMDVPMAPWWIFGTPKCWEFTQVWVQEVSESILIFLHDDPGSFVYWNLSKWTLLWRSLQVGTKWFWMNFVDLGSFFGCLLLTQTTYHIYNSVIWWAVTQLPRFFCLNKR